ncbi:transglycosylase SLT domain-containing protein [Streptomyces megasporus]|uniref:transglycosylase SLT domain-containing protein n=1 Tax=Streptomyces megasporus TaxID=44060 RepID=UPI0004E0F550|nr:LysM peptidoglycan-binding domain-containing protein [Streptomyces megasporus]
MSRGRHRRPRTPLISRHFSRLSLVLTAGGAGVAAPLLVAGSANAAPAAAQDTAPASQSRSDVRAETKAETKTEATPRSEAGAAESYTVVSGDTLHRIAVGNGVEGGWQTLYEANRKTVGSDPNLIFPGQKLTLAAERADTERGGAPDKAATPPVATQSQTSQSSAKNTSYPNNLDGWIREALDVMRANGIPGTYEGIHRNIMRESGGNPNAINNWDVNARRGTPSIGLLQVIKPTFDAYHVAGTANSQYDPVANIVAACNYAADRYGSIDNVNGPY